MKKSRKVCPLCGRTNLISNQDSSHLRPRLKNNGGYYECPECEVIIPHDPVERKKLYPKEK